MSKNLDKKFRQIAKVLKSYGTDGRLILSFRYHAPEDIKIEEPVFIYFDGLPVPFFIDSFEIRGSNRAFAHLTDVNSFEDAEELVGKAVYMDAAVLDEDLDEDDLSFLISWLLLKPEDGTTEEDIENDNFNVVEVGEISNFLDIPNNPCFEVQTDDGEILIPFHEDLILSFDPDNKEIIIDLPKGLL